LPMLAPQAKTRAAIAPPLTIVEAVIVSPLSSPSPPSPKDADSKFPQSRAEFERRFEPTRGYDDPLRQTVSDAFYATNEFIFVSYGGFLLWKGEFDEAVNRLLFGWQQKPQNQPSDMATEESFFGQPRFRSNVDTSSATFSVVVPFGR